MRNARRVLRILVPLAATGTLLVAAAPVRASEFGFRGGPGGFSAVATGEGGLTDLQAGSHPVALTTTVNFTLAGESAGQPGVQFTAGDVRDLTLELPPGLIENPTAVPQCSQADFHSPRSSPFESSRSGESCPARTQVGTVEVRSTYGGGSARTFGVFNLAPPPGAPSELGFNAYGAPIAFTPQIRQAEGEYGLSLQATGISQLVDINGLTLTIWGDPWSALHNSRRGNCLNEAEPTFGWAKCSVGPARENPATAYLTLPTACEGPMTFKATAVSWQDPAAEQTRTYATLPLQGCDHLPFQPTVTTTVTNPRASSPSGFVFDLNGDDQGLLDPGALTSSPIRRVVVKLPDGVTVNPSVGAGLGTCSPAQYAAETAASVPGEGCPNASKIGDFTVQSPLFPEAVQGSLFIASPHENPFGTLLAVYLVAKSTARGILVKVAGRIDADPADGRLIASFDALPQLPYSNLRIAFREGQRSPLATPDACGTFGTEIDLTPWRAPDLVRSSSSQFAIASGPGGLACPAGSPPFAPQAAAGMFNSNAGSYTPFYLHLTRSDGEQEITSYSTALPPGLTGKLAGIPYCSDAAIEAAKGAGGFAELAQPSCPAESRIGRTTAGYGVGSVLAFATGGLYLAGPFHGSPFSIVAIDSATVGPFDLGTVVIRSGIRIDPETAQVSIDSAGSDPIPHIIDGIPINLRDVRVYVDRPDFMLNPTSCEPFTVSSTLGGSGRHFSDPTDDDTASVGDPFQAFNCGALGFKPHLKLRLRGGTRRGQFPSLRAELTPRPGDANISSAVVTLPRAEFLAQAHIHTVCSRRRYATGSCPKGSVYGRARAFSPLLGAPLEGDVYLRTSDHTLPDLVAALRGGGAGLAIDVVGRIDSSHGGLRGSFETVPDAPVSRFVMRLFGGKRGLLVNSEDLCAAPLRARATFVGQNHVGERRRPAVRVSCERHRRRQHGHRRRTGGGRGEGR